MLNKNFLFIFYCVFFTNFFTLSLAEDQNSKRILVNSLQPKKQLIEEEPVKPILLFGKKTALVLIEYQNEWLSPEGKLNFLMKDRNQFQNAIQNSQRLINGARKKYIPIIHVGLNFNPKYPELGKAIYGLREAIPRVGTFVGNGADFTEPFKSKEGEFVVSGRTGASAFAGSNLDSYLRNQGIDTIIVSGFALHVCVESTIRQAHDLGYTTIIVEDATAAFTAEQRVHVLDNVIHHFGATSSTDAVLAKL